VDFNKEFSVCPEEFLSCGRATPFEGMRLHGEVVCTIAGGKVVYER
jgi:dihydroorotase